MNKRCGFIFIDALVVITVLIGLMAILVSNQRAQLQVVQAHLRQRRAEAAASAAVARAMASLVGENANEVLLTDNWALLGSSGNESLTLDDESSFRLQVIDASSLINVNTASQLQLAQLPLTSDQVDCLLDWREAGTNARSDGAKDAYYNALPDPYNTKLGPLSNVSELLLVKDWTGQTVYQAPTQTTTVPMPTDAQGNVLPMASILTVDSSAPNTAAAGGALINLDVRGLNAGRLARLGLPASVVTRLTTGPPVTSFQTLLALPGLSSANVTELLGAVTFTAATSTTGKLNLNTVSSTVLQTIPNVSQAIASAIVDQQNSGFTSLGQLSTVAGISRGQLAQIADDFTIGSNAWIVRAYGSSGGVNVALEVTIKIVNAQPQITSWNQINTPGIPAWWGWQTQTTTTEEADSTT